MTENLSEGMARRAERPLYPENMAGRGVVTCAGGTCYFTCAYVLARVLRETLNCQLPFELWHFGGEELSPFMREALTALNVNLVERDRRA